MRKRKTLHTKEIRSIFTQDKQFLRIVVDQQGFLERGGIILTGERKKKHNCLALF